VQREEYVEALGSADVSRRRPRRGGSIATLERALGSLWGGPRVVLVARKPTARERTHIPINPTAQRGPGKHELQRTPCTYCGAPARGGPQPGHRVARLRRRRNLRPVCAGETRALLELQVCSARKAARLIILAGQREGIGGVAIVPGRPAGAGAPVPTAGSGRAGALPTTRGLSHGCDRRSCWAAGA